MPQSIIKYLSTVLIFCMIFQHHTYANDESVQNVSAYVEDSSIVIHYDLLPEQMEKKYTVSIDISGDGGLTYDVTPRMIAGDLGRDILPGRNKRIVWIIERDFPAGIDLERYDFRITAKRQGFNRNILYAIIGAVVAGGGTAAYFLFGVDDDDSGFPQPPGRPE